MVLFIAWSTKSPEMDTASSIWKPLIRAPVKEEANTSPAPQKAWFILSWKCHEIRSVFPSYVALPIFPSMSPRCFWSFVKEIPLRTTFFEPSFARSLSMETMSSSPYSLSIRSLPSRKEAYVILGRITSASSASFLMWEEKEGSMPLYILPLSAMAGSTIRRVSSFLNSLMNSFT